MSAVGGTAPLPGVGGEWAVNSSPGCGLAALCQHLGQGGLQPRAALQGCGEGTLWGMRCRGAGGHGSTVRLGVPCHRSCLWCRVCAVTHQPDRAKTHTRASAGTPSSHRQARTQSCTFTPISTHTCPLTHALAHARLLTVRSQTQTCFQSPPQALSKFKQHLRLVSLPGPCPPRCLHQLSPPPFCRLPARTG